MLTAATNRQQFERYLTAADERQLFRHVAQFADVLAHRDHAWLRLLRHTGLRVNSLALLNVADATAAKISGALRVRSETAKGGRGYDVGLNKSARAALADLVKIRRQMIRQGADDGDALILCRRGKRISVRSLQHRMAHWCKSAGLVIPASPHWLRHTLAKRLIERSDARDPFGIVQVVLGHRSRNSTGIYALPDREQIAHALEAAA